MIFYNRYHSFIINYINHKLHFLITILTKIHQQYLTGKTYMKKEARKTLKVKLLSAINKVLKGSKVELSDKTEKSVKKSIKKIAQKADTLALVKK